MSVRCKYVMVEPPHLPGLAVPVVLPEVLQHELATKLGRPLSAGFFRRDETAEHGVKTYGFSTSLNLSPRPEDAKLIAKWFADACAPATTPSPP